MDMAIDIFFCPDNNQAWQWIFTWRVCYCPYPLTNNKEYKFMKDLVNIFKFVTTHIYHLYIFDDFSIIAIDYA